MLILTKISLKSVQRFLSSTPRVLGEVDQDFHRTVFQGLASVLQRARRTHLTLKRGKTSSGVNPELADLDFGAQILPFALSGTTAPRLRPSLCLRTSPRLSLFVMADLCQGAQPTAEC